MRPVPKRTQEQFQSCPRHKDLAALRSNLSMLLLGVPDSSLVAVSFGMEKPVDAGQNEEVWAKNHRVDIRYTAHRPVIVRAVNNA